MPAGHSFGLVRLRLGSLLPSLRFVCWGPRPVLIPPVASAGGLENYLAFAVVAHPVCLCPGLCHLQFCHLCTTELASSLVVTILLGILHH